MPVQMTPVVAISSCLTAISPLSTVTGILSTSNACSSYEVTSSASKTTKNSSQHLYTLPCSKKFPISEDIKECTNTLSPSFSTSPSFKFNFSSPVRQVNEVSAEHTAESNLMSINHFSLLSFSFTSSRNQINMCDGKNTISCKNTSSSVDSLSFVTSVPLAYSKSSLFHFASSTYSTNVNCSASQTGEQISLFRSSSTTLFKCGRPLSSIISASSNYFSCGEIINITHSLSLKTTFSFVSSPSPVSLCLTSHGFCAKTKFLQTAEQYSVYNCSFSFTSPMYLAGFKSVQINSKNLVSKSSSLKLHHFTSPVYLPISAVSVRGNQDNLVFKNVLSETILNTSPVLSCTKSGQVARQNIANKIVSSVYPFSNLSSVLDEKTKCKQSIKQNMKLKNTSLGAKCRFKSVCSIVRNYNIRVSEYSAIFKNTSSVTTFSFTSSVCPIDENSKQTIKQNLFLCQKVSPLFPFSLGSLRHEVKLYSTSCMESFL